MFNNSNLFELYRQIMQLNPNWLNDDDSSSVLEEQQNTELEDHKSTIENQYKNNQISLYRKLRLRRNRKAEIKQKSKQHGIFRSNQLEQQNFSYSEYLIPNTCSAIPNIEPTSVDNLCYSQDGSKLLVTTQNGLEFIQSDPRTGFYDENLTVQHFTPQSIYGKITDSDLSSDGRFLIHSSLNPRIAMFDIENKKYVQNFNFDTEPDQDDLDLFVNRKAFIFSTKFTHDASTIIAASGKTLDGWAYLKLFDVKYQYVTQSIKAHNNDINTVTFVDKRDSNLMVTGSDDATLKIWDTRALGINNKPVGYFLGHVSGITYISSREDGYYLASNAKDQTLKLWDLRKFDESCQKFTSSQRVNFDYRNSRLSEDFKKQIIQASQTSQFNNSILTFSGHEVYLTLIRCHFSPQDMTNKRYLYSGSSCGKIFIYDIFENSLVATLSNNNVDSVIRDCIWHPSKPSIIYGTSAYYNEFKPIYQWQYETKCSEENEKTEKIVQDKDCSKKQQ